VVVSVRCHLSISVEKVERIRRVDHLSSERERERSEEGREARKEGKQEREGSEGREGKKKWKRRSWEGRARVTALDATHASPSVPDSRRPVDSTTARNPPGNSPIRALVLVQTSSPRGRDSSR
jgi:hypothetical protein